MTDQSKSRSTLPALLTLREITTWLKIDRRTVYRRIERDGFPAPLKLGEGTSRWYEHEVKAWLEARRAA